MSFILQSDKRYISIVLAIIVFNTFLVHYLYGQIQENGNFSDSSNSSRKVGLIIGSYLGTAIIGSTYLLLMQTRNPLPEYDFAGMATIGRLIAATTYGLYIGSPIGAATGIKVVDKSSFKIFFFDVAAGFIPTIAFNILFYKNTKGRIITAPLSGGILSPIFVYYSHKYVTNKYRTNKSTNPKLSIYPLSDPSNLSQKNIPTGILISVSF